MKDATKTATSFKRAGTIRLSLAPQVAQSSFPFENAPPPRTRGAYGQVAYAITILADGRRFIDKRYRGVRIGLRVGAVAQEQAKERLRTEISRVESDLARKANARPTLTDCAARYVEQSPGKRTVSIELTAPVLLVVGLLTRPVAAVLLGMTAVIEIFVYPLP